MRIRTDNGCSQNDGFSATQRFPGAPIAIHKIWHSMALALPLPWEARRKWQLRRFGRRGYQQHQRYEDTNDRMRLEAVDVQSCNR
jgi:hypothetical protein